MPAPLIERGLAAAIQDLVDRIPLAARLDPGVNGALPEPVSNAAYFVVAEALANAVKHSHASCLAVRLARDRGARSARHVPLGRRSSTWGGRPARCRSSRTSCFTFTA